MWRMHTHTHTHTHALHMLRVLSRVVANLDLAYPCVYVCLCVCRCQGVVSPMWVTVCLWGTGVLGVLMFVNVFIGHTA